MRDRRVLEIQPARQRSFEEVEPQIESYLTDQKVQESVQRKVEAIHEAVRRRIGRGEGELAMRLVQPEYTVATSDGSS